MYIKNRYFKIYKYGFITYGIDNNSLVDRFCAFILAISCILQHYKGFYKNAGFSALLVISPYILLKLLKKMVNGKFDSRCLLAISPLMLFQLYKTFSHDISFSKLLYGAFMMVFFFAIASGCVNVRYFVKSATHISCIAGVCLIIQYILYYLLHFHLQFVPTSLLLPESSIWILGAKTGLINITGRSNGYYRPSAFFLEPSHLFIYCFPVLCLLLLSPNMKPWRMKMAFIITAGMVLSTSGMGLGVAIGLWGVYFALYKNGKSDENIARIRNLISPKNVGILIVFLTVLTVMYFEVDIFRNIVIRIFNSGSGNQSTAINGRVRLARMLVGGLSGKSFIFGVTDNVSEIEFNLSGFYATLYKYGLIGIFLSYAFYVQGLFKLKGAYFWLTCIIVVISFFTAHTHGTFYMMYYIIVLMDGHYAYDKKFLKRSIKTGSPWNEGWHI